MYSGEYIPAHTKEGGATVVVNNDTALVAPIKKTSYGTIEYGLYVEDGYFGIIPLIKVVGEESLDGILLTYGGIVTYYYSDITEYREYTINYYRSTFKNILSQTNTNLVSHYIYEHEGYYGDGIGGTIPLNQVFIEDGKIKLQFKGDVTKPAVDTRIYRYRGWVSKPDTRTYDYYYQYSVTVDYIENSLSELKIKINNQLKTSENGWVKIDNQLRDIEKMWVKINNQLHEI